MVVGGDGKLETRAERLAWLRSNVKDLAGHHTQRAIRPHLWQYGNRDRTGRNLARRGHSAIRERFTQVWVSEGGAWKMVTGQITLVKK
jgi:hypothetical protein